MGLYGILNKHKMQMILPTIGEEIKADNTATENFVLEGMPVKERKNTISYFKQRTSFVQTDVASRPIPSFELNQISHSNTRRVT